MASVGNPSPVQLHIWVQRKPGMTREQFIDYWANDHGEKFMVMAAVKKHCLKYEQYRDDPAERAAVEEAFGLPATKWDGFAILTFDSMEGARAVFQDPAFAQWAKEDEPNFCAVPNITMRIVVIGTPHIAYQR